MFTIEKYDELQNVEKEMNSSKSLITFHQNRLKRATDIKEIVSIKKDIELEQSNLNKIESKFISLDNERIFFETDLSRENEYNQLIKNSNEKFEEQRKGTVTRSLDNLDDRGNKISEHKEWKLLKTEETKDVTKRTLSEALGL